MDIVWLDADTVEKLSGIALYERKSHGRNPDSDLEGALARPKGHYHYGEVDSLHDVAALYAVALLAKAHALRWKQVDGPARHPRVSAGQWDGLRLRAPRRGGSGDEAGHRRGRRR